jgi:hypothetical protein
MTAQAVEINIYLVSQLFCDTEPNEFLIFIFSYFINGGSLALQNLELSLGAARRTDRPWKASRI